MDLKPGTVLFPTKDYSLYTMLIKWDVGTKRWWVLNWDNKRDVSSLDDDSLDFLRSVYRDL